VRTKRGETDVEVQKPKREALALTKKNEPWDKRNPANVL